MKAYILDANVLVRFFTQDSPAMGRASKKLLQDAADGDAELFLDAAIVAEVTFVLTGVYGLAREQVAGALLDLIENPGVICDDARVMRDALTRFKEKPVDFPDALVTALAVGRGIPVASFDRDIDKFKDVKRYEPKE